MRNVSLTPTTRDNVKRRVVRIEEKTRMLIESNDGNGDAT
ncbi:MAG: hypothetical protein S4CHLAM102_03800 [Chlamydiia bacterium]|nr:hypothetical protein [Chlamydiia bacterium]